MCSKQLTNWRISVESDYPDIRWVTVTEKIKSLYGEEFYLTVKNQVSVISKRLITYGYRHESYIRDPYVNGRILTVFEDSLEFEEEIKGMLTR